jgi:outer membrane protein TolC
VNLSGNYQYYLKMPTSLIPASLFGGPEGTYAAGTFGTRQTTTGTASMTQQLYNGQLLVGLKAAKVAGNVGELQVRATREDIAYNVAATYYNLQTLDKTLSILEQNLANQDALIRNTKLQLDNGLTNRTSYNRLVVNRENTAARIVSVRNDRLKLQNLLNFLMGNDVGQSLVVDSIGSNADIAATAVAGADGADSRTDLRLLEEQKNLSILSRKSEQAGYLPSLSATVNYGATGYNSQMAPFQNINGRFYPSSAFQLNLNIPVFDGFGRKSRIAQKSIDILRYETEIDLKRQTIGREVADAIADFNSNLATLRSSEQNRVLAEKIYNDLQLQYRNGLVSLNDVLTAQNEMNDAQTNYTNALVQLRTAELDLRKSRGQLLQP